MHVDRVLPPPSWREGRGGSLENAPSARREPLRGFPLRALALVLF